jgi:hypothetical protein
MITSPSGLVTSCAASRLSSRKHRRETARQGHRSSVWTRCSILHAKHGTGHGLRARRMKPLIFKLKHYPTARPLATAPPAPGPASLSVAALNTREAHTCSAILALAMDRCEDRTDAPRLCALSGAPAFQQRRDALHTICRSSHRTQLRSGVAGLDSGWPFLRVRRRIC